jgi:hypothetical protein
MKIKKEIKPIVSLIAAIVLGSIVIPFGILHNLIKPFIDAFKFKRLKPLGAFKYVLKYYLNFAYQIWNVLKRAIYDLAVSIDIFGNATSGEMIEDVLSPMFEDSHFGDGNVTISAAIGEAEAKKKLNKFGLFISKVLNIMFNERLHGIWSYEREILGKLTKENKGLK